VRQDSVNGCSSAGGSDIGQFVAKVE